MRVSACGTESGLPRLGARTCRIPARMTRTSRASPPGSPTMWDSRPGRAATDLNCQCGSEMRAIRVCVVCAVMLMGAAMASGSGGGNLPEGMWVLNRTRSVQLEPADQTLWIIKDDGKQLTWVLVSTD